MKSSSVGADLMHVDGQTDRQTDRQTDMIKLIASFRNFTNAPTKCQKITSEEHFEDVGIGVRIILKVI
jgi:hypothetical protein